MATEITIIVATRVESDVPGDVRVEVEGKAPVGDGGAVAVEGADLMT